MSVADQSGSFGSALSRAWRRLRRSMLGSGRGRMQMSGPAPERLLLAPPDLHTPDPTVAQEIYAGAFHLAGKTLDAAGSNPFALPAPTPAFARELHSFSWLRHLGAAGDPLSATNAQALVKDWIDAHPRPRDEPAWDAVTSAERLIAWLCHSVLIVEKADLASYRRFLKSIGYHVRYLRGATPLAADGMPRLMCLTALAYADICVASRGGTRTAQKNLDAELSRQVLADGGHVSRNPAVLADLLALLLPLRQSFMRVGQAPSSELLSAIDRMMLALRFFRMGDGALGRFNGSGHTPQSLISTVLRYDDVMGAIPSSAPYSGYQRMTGGEAIVIIDSGKPPSGELSACATAGALSFEFSDGPQPLVVNCGVPAMASRAAVLAGRSTAAHSTATLNDTSSCRFVVENSRDGDSPVYVTSGPVRVEVQRRANAEGETVAASHDGYLRPFGIIHERQLHLSSDGRTLAGVDRFHEPAAKKARAINRDAYAIRFHLHPSVEARIMDESIVLRCPGGALWSFLCEGALAAIEESVFFATPAAGRRSRQIVVSGNAGPAPEVRWSFVRR
jgi:uncharacterized heparinase superfamily protein